MYVLTYSYKVMLVIKASLLHNLIESFGIVLK